MKARIIDTGEEKESVEASSPNLTESEAPQNDREKKNQRPKLRMPSQKRRPQAAREL